MKKTLTAVALATSMLPLSNTSNADTDTNPELTSEDINTSSLENDNEIKTNKNSLSATITKDNAYLINENGEKVQKLKIGDKFQILKRFDDEPFVKVNFNGKALYLANDAINSTSLKSSGTDFKLNSRAKVVKVRSNDSLNVRDNDSVSGKVLFSLKNNTNLNVTERTKNGWYKIEYNGNSGFVNSNYIELINPKVIGDNFEGKAQILSETNAKELPFSNSNPTFNIPLNAQVNIVEKINNGWYKIKYYNNTGYINSSYLKILSTEDEKPNFTVNPINNIWAKIIGNSTIEGKKYPSSTSSTLNQLNIGAGVYITGETSNGWYQIKFYEQTLYVPKENVQQTTPEVNLTDMDTSGEVYNISANSKLHVRKQPNPASAILTSLNNTDKVHISGETSNNWYRLNLNDREGYVPVNNIRLSNSTVVTDLIFDGIVYNVESNDTLNIREIPEYNGKLLTTLKNNDRVKVTGITSNGWYRVDINGNVGYANKNYIKEFVPATTKYKVINSKINLRTSPSWSADTDGTASIGETLEVIEIKDGWASIYKDKKTLYAPANYLELINNNTPIEKPTLPEENKPSFTVTDFNLDGVIYNVEPNDTLNIRETPEYNGKLLTTLKNNDRVKVTGITSNGWYRVDINGNVGYANKNYIKEFVPATTKYKVINSKINLRTSPSWSADTDGTASIGETLEVIEIKDGWASIYKDKKTLYAPVNYLELINSGNSTEDKNDSIDEQNTIYTKYDWTLSNYIKIQSNTNSKYNESFFENYINPAKCNKFEFLRLDKFRNLDVNKVNNLFASKKAGVLINTGQAFLDTCKKYSLDPLYFISQSIHETGWGKSVLSSGVTITKIANTNKPIKDSKGNITGYEMIPLSEPTTVYNLFGIGAYDNLPTMPNRALVLGTTYAYNQGWTSIEKAIDGAGAFISSSYINSSKYKQNTLYKIKYNPSNSYIWHQYATTPWYSRDIALFMEQHQDFYIDKDFTFDKPLFKNMEEYSATSRSTNLNNTDTNEMIMFGKEIDVTLR